jgi:hypothetical protein
LLPTTVGEGTRSIVLAMRLLIRAMTRHGHATLRLVTTGLDPVVHADATPTSAGGKHCASEASAWMPGSSPGMTKEGTKEISEAKRRQTW